MFRRISLFSFIFVFCLLEACSYGVQATSGAAYLDKYKDSASSSGESKGESKTIAFSDQLKIAARLEPTLRFPARIGIARVGSNGLTAIPEKELEHWRELEKRLGVEIGTFVPLTELGERLANEAINQDVHQDMKVKGAVNKIRLTAARQHLDAVLVYEALDEFESTRNYFAFMDIALVTLAVIPSRNLSSRGYANAILIDVMQGYHYGSAAAYSEKERGFTTAVNVPDKRKIIANKVEAEAVLKLTGEVEKMFNGLFSAVTRLKK